MIFVKGGLLNFGTEDYGFRGTIGRANWGHWEAARFLGHWAMGSWGLGVKGPWGQGTLGSSGLGVTALRS